MNTYAIPCSKGFTTFKLFSNKNRVSGRKIIFRVIYRVIILAMLAWLLSLPYAAAQEKGKVAVRSPNGAVTVTLVLDGGVPYYQARPKPFQFIKDVPTDWKNNPYAMMIENKRVTARTMLSIRLATSGGEAIRFTPVGK